ncbi:MAG: recombinase family protein [Rhodospirillales bacterium]|nr:recombinase family protein [Rhodospirillales bacterium]
MPPDRARLNCAIYTRKSSEEGLEQEFNSLDAQRESCEAYIQSQKHEGWKAVRTHYDDGGFSGGNMGRPGLKNLLADIDAGRVQVVVVYKVDRLTRSLADFAKIIEAFDAHGVSFVSVTQQFNTTSSMGRLTLNVLLSFAQFEREVTGERIRDKIAASKKKGMWMGGNPPLGYDCEERKLVVVEKEAETVRHIFRRYTELGCVRRLKEELEAHGVVSKVRVYKNGRCVGGKSFSRGALYHMLRNRIYLGEIVHKEESYPGEHDAIVGQELWDEVQKIIAANRTERRSGNGAREPSLLGGLLFDAEGHRLTPSHANKRGKRYRYYVSETLRLPASELENAVTLEIVHFLKNSGKLIEALAAPDDDVASSQCLGNLGAATAQRLKEGESVLLRTAIQAFVSRVELGTKTLTVACSRAALRQWLIDPEVTTVKSSSQNSSDVVELAAPFTLKRRGVEAKLILDPDVLGRRPKVDSALIKVIAKAFAWNKLLIRGEVSSMREIAKRTGLTPPYVRRLFKLAFLAPDIVEAVLAGHQPVDLTAQKLTRFPEISRDWASQRHVLSFNQ